MICNLLNANYIFKNGVGTLSFEVIKHGDDLSAHVGLAAAAVMKLQLKQCTT